MQVEQVQSRVKQKLYETFYAHHYIELHYAHTWFYQIDMRIYYRKKKTLVHLQKLHQNT